jgi:hypothetical protein
VLEMKLVVPPPAPPIRHECANDSAEDAGDESVEDVDDELPFAVGAVFTSTAASGGSAGKDTATSATGGDAAAGGACVDTCLVPSNCRRHRREFDHYEVRRDVLGRSLLVNRIHFLQLQRAMEDAVNAARDDGAVVSAVSLVSAGSRGAHPARPTTGGTTVLTVAQVLGQVERLHRRRGKMVSEWEAEYTDVQAKMRDLKRKLRPLNCRCRWRK